MPVNGLQFQTVDVRFTEGLDTKTQPKLVIPGKWQQLQNCTLEEDDTPKRRDGITALVAAATGNGLATYNKELLVVSGGGLKSVSTAGADQAVSVGGRIGYVGVSKQEIRRSTGMQDSLDCAHGSGFTCYAWGEKSSVAVRTGLRMSLLDETTGTQMQADVLLRTGTTAFCPRVVYVNASATDPAAFFIFYIDGTSLYCRVVQATTPTTLGAEVALLTSASLAALSFDACAFSSTNATAMVSYGWADGVTSVKTIAVAHTAGVPSVFAGPTNLFAEVQLPIATLSGLACVALSSSLAATLTLSSGAAAMAGTAGATINASWVVVTAATLISADPPGVAGNCHITAVATALGGGSLHVYTDRRSSWATAGLTPIVQNTVSATMVTSLTGTVMNSAAFAGAATDPAGPKGPWIAGKAFATSTGVFLPVEVLENYQGLAATKASNNQQNTFFLLDCANAFVGPVFGGIVVAKALYGAVGVATINANPPAVSTPCSTPALAAGGYAYATTERTLLSFEGGFNVSPSGVVRLTLTPNTTVPPVRAQLGEAAYFSGGSVAAYDGLGATEAAFPLFPEGINVEVVVGGGAMTAGVHQVVVIAEWVDNSGQRWQSAPSLAVSATTAANDRLRVRVPSLLLSQKTGVNLVAYITQAAGLTFNRVGTAAAGSSGTANDVTLAFTTLALIDAADATYAGNELLYTQPNQAGTTLPSLAPGPTNALAVIQNRLWFDKADQPGQFGYSQQYVNNVGLQFNEQLGGTVDVNAGAIVGFAALDEKTIIFCERKPYVVYGTGPNAAGGFSNYSEPQEVPSDVGCVEARSILEMPQGIIFKSPKGWYLLGRDLTTRYIGEGAAAFDANSVSGAVLLEDRHECRFSSTSGTQLIYAYDNQGGQWSTTVYRANSGAAVTNVAVADAIWWPTSGRYVTVSLTHGLNHDTPGTYYDQPGTSPAVLTIPTTARTAWLRLSIINGFQRVRRMFLTGTAESARPESALVVTVDFDDSYGLTAPGSYQFTFNYLTAFASTPASTSVDIRHHLRRQKCKSVAFTFTDTPTEDTPQGVVFQALSLELGLKRGLNKLPAAQSS